MSLLVTHAESADVAIRVTVLHRARVDLYPASPLGTETRAGDESAGASASFDRHFPLCRACVIAAQIPLGAKSALSLFP
ncbi:MAG: hypothetical protein V4472_10655 [Pseudomonadota bacterium]